MPVPFSGLSTTRSVTAGRCRSITAALRLDDSATTGILAGRDSPKGAHQHGARWTGGHRSDPILEWGQSPARRRAVASLSVAEM